MIMMFSKPLKFFGESVHHVVRTPGELLATVCSHFTHTFDRSERLAQI